MVKVTKKNIENDNATAMNAGVEAVGAARTDEGALLGRTEKS